MANSERITKDIDLLEKIQHRATELVSDISSLSYTVHLRCLGLHSLYCQRQRGDLIEAFKIIKNLIYSVLSFPVQAVSVLNDVEVVSEM